MRTLGRLRESSIIKYQSGFWFLPQRRFTSITEQTVFAAASREKEATMLEKLEQQGLAVPHGVLDPLMAVLVQVLVMCLYRRVTAEEVF